MDSSMTSSANSAANNHGNEFLPSTVTFFPDISIFEEAEEEQKSDSIPIVSDWALKKIGTLQSRLENLQSDRGNMNFFGKRFQLSNFASHIIINLANDTFGYDGWSSEILECLLIDESISEKNTDNPRYSAFFMAKVRVTLRDGTYCDGTGKGEASNLPYKYMCYSNGKKQAITDGVKSAITGFPEKLLDFELACIQHDSYSAATLAFLHNIS